LKAALTANGKLAGRKQLDEAKIGVAEAIAASTDEVLILAGRRIFQQIVDNLHLRLSE
jgi:hypothetical protein